MHYKGKPKVYIIYGPTASGKTSLAIKLARKLNGEIINADSRQIYKYMNIGTNKEPIKEVKTHLFDITTPDKPISLAEYQKFAFEVIEKILKKGKTPVIVGGTGLYISAISKGYSLPSVEPNKSLRRRLEKLTVPKLQKELKKLNKKKFESLNNSDQNNPRRLVRAIEIERSKKKESSEENSKELPYKFVYKKPKYKIDNLKKKIDKRVEEMFKLGFVNEVKRLLKRYPENLEAFSGMGYKEVIDYLKGKADLNKTKELVKIAHRQYAKRQETWIKKYIE